MKSITPLFTLFLVAASARGDEWPQLQGNALRSGNAPAAEVKTPLGLVGAVPLTDGIYAAPVVADGKVFVVDGSGVVVAFDAQSLKELWRFATRGGAGDRNKDAPPPRIGQDVHPRPTARHHLFPPNHNREGGRENDPPEPRLSSPPP